MVALRLGNCLAWKADRIDLIREVNWLSHVEQGDVTVEIVFPVVLRMNNNFVNSNNFLSSLFISKEVTRGSRYTKSIH